MDDWITWEEHGAPERCDAHYFAATICGKRFTVTKPSHCNKWHAFDVAEANGKCDPQAGRIGHEYDSMCHAMRACSRAAGNGEGVHGYTRSRQSLIVEADKLVRKNGGPAGCTFDAMSNHEIWAMIADLRIEANG